MGYFSNGTEGDLYEKTVCRGCVFYARHTDDDPTTYCPVLLAHALYQHHQDTPAEDVLDLLIPRAGVKNEQCAMFWSNPKTHKTHRVHSVTAILEAGEAMERFVASVREVEKAPEENL